MIYDITIKAVLNGYSVKVGCQTLVFNSRKELLQELDRYLEKPSKVEKEYREGAINREILSAVGVGDVATTNSINNYAVQSPGSLSAQFAQQVRQQ